MKTKLTWGQTRRGQAVIKNVLPVLIMVGIVIWFITPFMNVDGFSVLMVGVILFGLVAMIVPTFMNVSLEQQKWLSEHATREVTSQKSYVMTDFFPRRQYVEQSDNQFKPEPPRNLQDELERQADEIMFQTGAPTFQAVLSTTTIADPDVRNAVAKPEKTLLTYHVPASAEAFKKWSAFDRPFLVENVSDINGYE